MTTPSPSIEQPSWPEAGSRRALGVTLGIVAVSWLLLFAPRFNFGYSAPYDAYDAYFPWIIYNLDVWRDFDIATWNPFVYGGYSSISDPQNMAFSPLLMGTLLLAPEPSLVWFDAAVLLHLLVGGLGLAFLLRGEFESRIPTLAAAVVFMAGGYATARLQQPAITIAYCCLPWVFFGYRRVMESPGVASALLLGAAVGVQFLHLVQVSYLTVFCIGAHFILSLLTRETRPSLRLFTALLGSIVLALLIAGIQILPFLLVFPYYTRHDMSLTEIASNNIDLITFLTIPFPNIFNVLEGVFSNYEDKTQALLFYGTPFFVFSCIGLFGRKRPGFDCRRLAILVVVISFVYAIGTLTPIYVILYNFVPGVSLFRRPMDALFTFNAGIAILTAFGVARFIDWCRTRPTAAALTIGAVAALCAINLADNLAYPRLRLVYAVGTVLCLALLLSRRSALQFSGAALAALLVVAGTTELAVLNVANDLNADLGIEIGAVRNRDGQLISALHLVSQPGNVPDRFDADRGFNFPQNWSPLLGLATINGYNAFRYGLVDQLVRPAESDAVGRPTDPGVDIDWYRWLLRSNVRRTEQPLDPLSFECRTGVQGDDHWICVRRNRLPLVLNPTNVAAEGAVAPGPWSYDPRQTAILDTELPATCHGAVTVKDVHFRKARIDVDFTTETGGLLVLTEPWHPYWYAKVDGQRTPILKANGINRAVCVPPGAKRLVMKYQPYSWASVMDFVDKQILHRTPS